MIKDMADINSDIKHNQEKELEYKGKINNELYIIGLSVDLRTVMDIRWEGRDTVILNGFINKAIDSGIPRVIITNRNEDWNVAAYAI